MRVTVELHGNLQTYTRDRGNRLEVEVEEGTTVGELMARLGVAKEAVWNAAMDGHLVYAADPLTDGSEVMVFPPLSGG